MQTLTCSCYSQSVHISLITQDVEPRISKRKDLNKTLQTLSKNYNKENFAYKIRNLKNWGSWCILHFIEISIVGMDGQVIRAALQSHNCCSHNIRKLILIHLVMVIILNMYENSERTAQKPMVLTASSFMKTTSLSVF